MNAIQRWPIVGAIGALLIGAVLLDRVPENPPPQLQPLETVMQRSLVQQPASLTASWYCVVGSSEPGGYADQTINVSNISDEPATATVSIITDEGPGPSIRLELGSYSTESVDIGSVSSAANAAAVVEVVGGAGRLERRVEQRVHQRRLAQPWAKKRLGWGEHAESTDEETA